MPLSYCARGGNRTRTSIAEEGILSPSCLPISPLGRAGLKSTTRLRTSFNEMPLKKPGASHEGRVSFFEVQSGLCEPRGNYIMPPIPPPIPPSIGGMGASFLGSSTMVASVVSNKDATEAAFSKATRVTFVGSMMPASLHWMQVP